MTEPLHDFSDSQRSRRNRRFDFLNSIRVRQPGTDESLKNHGVQRFIFPHHQQLLDKAEFHP